MSAPDDDLVRRYREASAHEEARPGAHVRDAVRAHAQMLAAAAQTPTPTKPPLHRAAANQSRWKISALATVAVVGLSGLLMLQFERGTPEERDTAFGQRRAHAPATAPSPTSSTPAVEPAAEAPSAAPSAEAGLPGSARDAVSPLPQSTAQAPAPPAPAQAKPLARSAPAPAPSPAPVANEAETSGDRSGSNAVSGFPASPPITANRTEAPRPAPPPAPSAPRAEMRENAPAPSESVTRELRSPPQPQPQATAAAAAARAAKATERSASDGSMASRKLGAIATASSADAASSGSLAQDLLEAARAGNTPQVERFTTQGAPVDARDNQGATALMLAATNGHTATVQKLLALGANSTLVDREGLTAAQQARRRGHTGLADLIDAAR